METVSLCLKAHRSPKELASHDIRFEWSLSKEEQEIQSNLLFRRISCTSLLHQFV